MKSRILAIGAASAIATVLVISRTGAQAPAVPAQPPVPAPNPKPAPSIPNGEMTKQRQEKHKDMLAAMTQLQKAEALLKKDPNAYNGFRKKAVEDTHEAIIAIQHGILWDNDQGKKP